MKIIDKNQKLKLDSPLIETIKGLGIYALYFMGGFILSLGNVTGELKPFALSFVAVAKKWNCAFAALGAAIGYFIFGLDISSARYFCAIVAICAISLLCELIDAGGITPSLISAFLTCLLSGILINIKMSSPPTEYLLTLAESILALGGAYFYYKSINANFKQLRLKALPLSDITCITISVATLFLFFGQLTIGIIRPFVVLSTIAVLFAVRYGNEKWGVICALTFGFVLGIQDKESLVLCGAMGLSAMICSLFTSMAGLGVGLSYLAGISFFAIASTGEIGLSLFSNGILGVLLFLLFPSKICDKIEDLVCTNREVTPDGTLRQNLVLRLRFASSAMTAISDSVEQVRERVNAVSRKNNEALKASLSKEEYINREIISERTNQIRMVAGDQFNSIADMLGDLAIEFSEAEAFDDEAQQEIRQLLAQYEIFPRNVCAIIDKYGRMRVEILTDSSPSKLDNKALQEEIGKICNRYFDSGRITNFANDSMLSFTEKPNYILNFGFAQYSAEGKLCGDTVKIINDGKGHSVLIISDGMGKGSSAALDGAMGAGLISRLIHAGFGFDSALKIVNSALLIKSNDESLATLDIANIDLFTGKCEIFKAGAPSGFIIKNGNITKCELSSMPVGILRGIEFAKRTAILSPNDSIILMSDGITDLGDEWLNRIFSSLPYQPQECADYILSCALKDTENKKRDDMSIIYARLERN